MGSPPEFTEIVPSSSVTVITMTRKRPRMLKGAIESVAAQCCAHVAEHLIIVDDCADTWSSLACELPDQVRPRWASRSAGEETGPRRLGKLRDLGVKLARTPWVAFLDDDDRWTDDHLHSLLQTATETGVRAAHSWLDIRNADGSKWFERRYPWAKGDEQRQREEYQRLAQLGVVRPGSNIIRASADPSVALVDGGAWLLNTELARHVGFQFEYTSGDFETLEAEDDKFLFSLIISGEPTACSRKATMIYHLGGYSNRFDGEGRPSMAGDADIERVSWN